MVQKNTGAADNIDLDTLAATLSTAFNNINAGLAKGIKDAVEEMEMDSDEAHGRAAEAYVALAKIADTLVRIDTAARARKGLSK